MSSYQTLPLFLAFAASSFGAASASPARSHLASRQECDTYTLNGTPGGFTMRNFTDFTTATAGGNLTAFLGNNSMHVSDYSVPNDPLNHTFTPANAALSTVDGFTVLDLKVSAYTSGNVICAAVGTDSVSIEYASVRTMLKSSPVEGIVEGNFFYLNNYQEIDFEILTTTALKSIPNVSMGIWATNQATTEGGNKTYEIIPFSFDPSEDFHEYRIDWTSAASTFFIDGNQVASLTDNLPTNPGGWIWNVWSNGNPTWSAGPPTEDTHTYIKTIDMYTGYTDTVNGTACSI